MDNTGAPIGPPVTATDVANYFGSGPAITLTKDVNGQHETTVPGLILSIGDPVTFTYVVTNTGNVSLDPVTLNDDVLGLITCPQTILVPGASETCTAAGGTATAGDHPNTGTVTGQGVDNTGAPTGSPVTATDVANYFGVLNTPAISVVKDVNGEHEPNPPGLYIADGQPITFTFTVTNTGDATLDSLAVVDSVLGPVTCPQASLAPGDTETCTAPGGKETAGQHQDTATATGQGVSNLGTPIGPPVSATDTADDFGANTGITLTKDVNGQHEPSAPGLSVPVGSTITFTYVVTNTGNVTLDAVAVSDNVLGPISCPQSTLAPGVSETCTKAQTAAAGQHVNMATVTGQPVGADGTAVGAETSASDPANYTGMTATAVSTPAATTTTTVAPGGSATATTSAASPTAATPPQATATTPESTSPSQLPFTGANLVGMAELAGIFILAGLGLTAVVRRRSHTT